MQREFRRLVEEASASGATVLLSSHVLSEVELVCNRIGLIRAGRLFRVGTLEQLREVRVHRVEAVVTAAPEASRLERLPGVSEVRVDGDRVNCVVHGSIGPLVQYLATAGVVELDSRELSLEEVFLSEFQPAS